MASLLIAVIYLAFISLGLPDSLLGAAWPAMHESIAADISSAGYISFIISGCTVLSALSSDRLTHRFGPGKVIVVSVLMTASAMLGFSLSHSLLPLLLLAIPYGLGAGAIDSALNNFVALHLESKHMNWLHCSWGIGASISPYIMGFCLSGSWGWRGGYRVVAIVQFVLSLAMFLSLPLWRKASEKPKEQAPEEKTKILSIPAVLHLPGAKSLLLAFLLYCAIETIPFVWAGTYFSEIFTVTEETAAFYASLFYIGMTVSRCVCGFISMKFSDRQLIRLGVLFSLTVSVLLAIPLNIAITSGVLFALLGFGCGPIYPAIIHSTPELFGKNVSGSVIGIEIAFAYTGTTFAPLIFGKIAGWTTLKILPFSLILLCVLVLVLTERAERICHKELERKHEA